MRLRVVNAIEGESGNISILEQRLKVLKSSESATPTGFSSNACFFFLHKCLKWEIGRKNKAGVLIYE